ncbi:hypothetical protein [Pontibacter anaerobius]|uniref:VCBS repeat-containing protein n=1 Tax=Pontibacter anaerobius TaxID=2993940 RepID=A0ABT3RK16_9BACT|nr:hypothetical protein [Pontibacter anaerobius]MCX2742166.1 hypothetical protein [Pontibacter anaerobius]
MNRFILPLCCCLLSSSLPSHAQVAAAGNLSEKYKNLEIIGEAAGDLDRDGIPEKVVVYNTDRETDEGYVRVLHIYKKKGEDWEVWQASENAILKSEEGGMMRDPFGLVEIINGVLNIYHSGGSSWKWSEIHKYRFQHGAFYLIGVTSYYGKPCEYVSSFDYNLSAGKAKYKKAYEECRTDGEQLLSRVEEEDFTHELAELPTLQTISFGTNKVVSPKLQAEVYF